MVGFRICDAIRANASKIDLLNLCARVLWKMIQTRKPYDADLHACHQKQHGFWVLALMKPDVKAGE
jgi:hypothetical protein